MAAEREYAMANGIVKPMVRNLALREGTIAQLQATDDLNLEAQAPVPKPRENVRRAFSVSECEFKLAMATIK